MIDGKEHVVNERDFAFVPANIEHRFSKVMIHLNSLKGDGMQEKTRVGGSFKMFNLETASELYCPKKI